MDPNAVLPIVGVAPASAGAGVGPVWHTVSCESAQIATRCAMKGEALIHAVRLVNIGRDSHGGSLVQPPLNESG